MSQTVIGCGTASYTFTDLGLSGVAPPAQPFTIGFADPVGTLISERPPDRSVRARPRIRLL